MGAHPGFRPFPSAGGGGRAGGSGVLAGFACRECGFVVPAGEPAVYRRTACPTWFSMNRNAVPDSNPGSRSAPWVMDPHSLLSSFPPCGVYVLFRLLLVALTGGPRGGCHFGFRCFGFVLITHHSSLITHHFPLTQHSALSPQHYFPAFVPLKLFWNAPKSAWSTSPSRSKSAPAQFPA